MRTILLVAVTICALLAGCGAPMGMQRRAYLVKPGTDNPIHVVRCEDRPRSGGQWATTYLVPFGFLVGPALGYDQCIKERTAEGYVEAPEPECAYWRDDAKPADEIKMRDSCKDNPPEWARRR